MNGNNDNNNNNDNNDNNTGYIEITGKNVNITSIETVIETEHNPLNLNMVPKNMLKTN